MANLSDANKHQYAKSLLNLLFSRMFSASMKIQPKQQKKLQSFSNTLVAKLGEDE